MILDQTGNQLLQIDAKLRQEADGVLAESGLMGLLSEYGVPSMQGSYLLRLMTRRDLDIIVASSELSNPRLGQMGGDLISRLKPLEMFHFNTVDHESSWMRGRWIYWGLIHMSENGQWKIDISVHDPAFVEARARDTEALARQITEAHRLRILEIKTACSSLPEYHSQCWEHWQGKRFFGSIDIYKAVTCDGIRDAKEFVRHMERKWQVDESDQ